MKLSINHVERLSELIEYKVRNDLIALGTVKYRAFEYAMAIRITIERHFCKGKYTEEGEEKQTSEKYTYDEVKQKMETVCDKICCWCPIIYDGEYGDLLNITIDERIKDIIVRMIHQETGKYLKNSKYRNNKIIIEDLYVGESVEI